MSLNFNKKLSENFTAETTLFKGEGKVIAEYAAVEVHYDKKKKQRERKRFVVMGEKKSV